MSINAIHPNRLDIEGNPIPPMVTEGMSKTSEYYQEYFSKEYCSPLFIKKITIPFKGTYTLMATKAPIEYEQFVEEKKSAEQRKRWLSLLFVALVCACIAATVIVLVNKYIINVWR